MNRPNGRRRPGPRLRHHLEESFDRELDRLLGGGSARRRDRRRREEQYARRAERLFEQFIAYELIDEPDLDGARLVRVEMQSGGGPIRLDVEVADSQVDGAMQLAPALEGVLRHELSVHLPRRRVPVVKLRLVVRADGEDSI